MPFTERRISLHLFNIVSSKTDKHLASLCSSLAVPLDLTLIYWAGKNKTLRLYYLTLVLVPAKKAEGSSWDIGQGDRHLGARWLSMPGIIIQAHSRQGQRGHKNFSAIVQPLFGLAELSKSRIWPQHNAKPTNLSRGIRKRPQHMRFTGSLWSLRIFSHPEMTCPTFNVFFPLAWVCYYLSSSHWFSHESGYLLCLFMGTRHTEVKEIWWRASQTKVGYCASICNIININTHTVATPCPILSSNRE